VLPAGLDQITEQLPRIFGKIFFSEVMAAKTERKKESERKDGS